MWKLASESSKRNPEEVCKLIVKIDGTFDRTGQTRGLLEQRMHRLKL
jgi:hypothetical protein